MPPFERYELEVAACCGEGRADPTVGVGFVENVGGGRKIDVVDAVLVGGGFPLMAVPVDVGFCSFSRREGLEQIGGVHQSGDPGRLVAGSGILDRRLRVVMTDQDGGLGGMAVTSRCVVRRTGNFQ